jgi:hypothetical protein
MSPRRPPLELEQLEERDVPATASASLMSYVDALGGSLADDVRTVLSDIHDANAALASSWETAHADVTRLQQMPSLSFLAAGATVTGSTGAQIASAEFVPFLTKGFAFEAEINPSSLHAGTIVSKYDSSLGSPDCALTLRITPEGKVLLYVYQDGNGNDMRGVQTAAPVIHTGEWQKIGAVFDPANRRLAIMVDGMEASVVETIPGTVRFLNSGTSPVRLGSMVGGSGNKALVFQGEMRNARFQAVDAGQLGDRETARNALFQELLALERSADAADAAALLAVDVRDDAASPVPEVSAITLADMLIEDTGSAVSADQLRQRIADLQGSVTTLIASGTTIAHTEGSDELSSADFERFRMSGFAFDVDIRPDAIANGAIASKYDSSLSTADRAFHLSMNAEGRLTFHVYQDGEGTVMRSIQTTDSVIRPGLWQHVRATFDAASQQMRIAIDGVDIPVTYIVAGVVRSLNAGPAPVRLGYHVGGNGPGGYFQGTMRGATLSLPDVREELDDLQDALVAIDPSAATVPTAQEEEQPSGNAEQEASDIPPARQWESGAPYDLNRILGALQIVRLGQGQTVGGGTYLFINNADTSQYRRIEATALNGSSVEFREVLYVCEAGMLGLPPAYYERINSTLILLKPNAPQNIVVGVAGRDATIVVDSGSGSTRNEVVPPEGLSIALKTLSIRQMGNEGSMDWPLEVPSDNASAQPGDTVNILYGIINEGMGSTSATVRVHVGPSGSVNDPVIKEMAIGIGTRSRSAFAVNVKMPSDGNAVTLEVVTANGDRYLQGTNVQTPRYEREREGWVDAYTWNRNVVAVAHAGDEDGGAAALARFDIAYSDNPIIVAQAQQDLVEMGVGEIVALEEGVGGSTPESNLSSSRTLFEEIVAWYDPNAPLPSGIASRNDTFVGRIFLGMVQQLWSAPDAQAVHEIATKTEAVTDIPTWKIEAAYSLDATTFSANITQLFRDAQYEHLFDTPRGGTMAMFVNADADYAEYHGGDVRIRFDIDPAGKALNYVKASYIFDGIGHAVGGTRAGTFIDIPVTSLVPTVGDEQREIMLTAYFTDGTSVSMRSTPFTVDWRDVVLGNAGDLSTRVESDPLRKLEGAILDQLSDADHFIIRNPDQWYWLIGSNYHHGSALNAVDLNALDGADLGKPVYAPADGKVIRVGTDENHTVVIEHTIMVDGVQHTWYTKILHMQNIQVQEGDEISQGTQIGECGREGTTSPHIHASFHVDSVSSNAIDLRKLLMDEEGGFGMAVHAFDVGPDGSQGDWGDGVLRNVQWSEALHTFVTTNPDSAAGVRLVLDRSAQSSSDSSSSSPVYWLLEEFQGQPLEEMERVVWIGETADHVKINAWVSYDAYQLGDYSEQWDSETRSWITR